MVARFDSILRYFPVQGTRTRDQNSPLFTAMMRVDAHIALPV
jgi:hypothetical protein